MLTSAAPAPRKAGECPSIVCLLAVVVSELLHHLQSARLNSGIALEVGSSEHFDYADTPAVFDREKLLACVVFDPAFPGGTTKRIVMQSKDKPFWDYHYTGGTYFERIFMTPSNIIFRAQNAKPRSINCKTYTPPPKPSSTLRNLNNPTLPEDVIGLIGLFADSAVHCSLCELANFSVEFLEKCSTPSTVGQSLKVQKEVQEGGGNCEVGLRWEKHHGQGSRPREHTVQSCMKLDSYIDTPKLQHQQMVLNRKPNIVACHIESERETQSFIKKKEMEIRVLQRVVASPKLHSESDQSDSDTQLFIKRQQTKLLALQKVVDSRRQDIINNKHVFEGL